MLSTAYVQQQKPDKTEQLWTCLEERKIDWQKACCKMLLIMT